MFHYSPWFVLLLFLLMYSINSFHLDVQTAQSANSPKITSDVSNHRRTLLLTSSALVLGGTTSAKSANALPLFEKKNRRQLELCIVNVLRIQYWSRNIADKLQNAETEEEKRKAYLEARLAAKAMVADRKIKVGGGASYFVLTLRGLQIKEVLEDLRYYAKSKVMDQYKDDLIESLASLVEFDGLETTQDPSPRSTLTLSMYTNDKNIFVRRMLTERIIPLTDQIVYLFGKESVKQCESYIEQYYPTELPKQPTQQQAERIKETVTEKEG